MDAYLERHDGYVDVEVHWNIKDQFTVVVETEDVYQTFITRDGSEALEIYNHPMVYVTKVA